MIIENGAALCRRQASGGFGHDDARRHGKGEKGRVAAAAIGARVAGDKEQGPRRLEANDFGRVGAERRVNRRGREDGLGHVGKGHVHDFAGRAVAKAWCAA